MRGWRSLSSSSRIRLRASASRNYLRHARSTGAVRIINIVRARLDAKNDCYLTELPSPGLRDVRIDEAMVNENERLLTDGFYAVVAEENGGRPFSVSGLRPIHMSKSVVLEVYSRGRRQFNATQWNDLLIRSAGLEPAAISERGKLVMLLRMIPFVERNYNLVERGPRGTGKGRNGGFG